MKWLYSVFLCFLATSAVATVDAWPALYDVTGVAANDNLNVREDPSSNAIMFSSLPPNATNIEVIAVNDAETWGLINSDGRSGWVSMQFMQRHPDQHAGAFPAITYCHGNEPFWSVELSDTTLTFSAMGDGDFNEQYHPFRSANRIDRFALATPNVTAVIMEQQCSDGMSDMTYGLTIEMLAPLYGETALVSGCCTIQP